MLCIVAALAGLTAAVVFADDAAVPQAPDVASPTGGATPAQPGFMAMAFPFIAMFAVFYFLMVRPQQKKLKDHQKLLSDLKKGDEVITASGFIGSVAGIAEKVVTLDLGSNCKVKILKTQISQINNSGTIKDL